MSQRRRPSPYRPPVSRRRRGASPGVRALVVVLAVALLAGGAWLLLGTPPLRPTGTPATPAAPAATVATAPTGTGRTATTSRPKTTTARPAPTPRPTAGSWTDPASGLRWVDLGALPHEASDTLALIRAGGPFPYAKDGAVFSNFEGILPRKPSGYYHEFTVRTPGEGDRGARRIVTGGPANGVTNGEFYYTGDHYDSFERIRP